MDKPTDPNCLQIALFFLIGELGIQVDLDFSQNKGSKYFKRCNESK